MIVIIQNGRGLRGLFQKQNELLRHRLWAINCCIGDVFHHQSEGYSTEIEKNIRAHSTDCDIDDIMYDPTVFPVGFQDTIHNCYGCSAGWAHMIGPPIAWHSPHWQKSYANAPLGATGPINT